MTSERWQQIERLYHGALEREPGQRAAWLEQACGSDPSLRRQVEGLLAREDEARDFIETPAIHVAARNMAAAASEISPGQILDRYRIVAPLGAGGMGKVYTARDTRLERTVALKFLLEEFTGDAGAMERFRREARALSALNHPNICTIYDIAEADGRTFIAMEYVAGKSLDRLIGRKGLPLREALKYAVEIADGLAKAHAAGIVHRDLKPGNVMIAEEGHVKLLDFGLAKLTAPLGEDSATGTMHLGDAPRTVDGTIVGTVAYMSPEQAQGKNVDARSDLFSFGAVLYEMITGRRAFAGETKVATLTAILHSEPPEGIPPELQRIVARCLRKDPERRFQTAADLKVALQEVREESESGKPAPALPAAPRRSGWIPTAAVAILFALAAVVVTWRLTKTPPKTSRPMVFTRITSDSGLTMDPAISPDGKLVAYASDRSGAGNLDIWVQQTAGGQPIQLTHNGSDNTEPAFSPDGSMIVFCSQRDGGGVYVISALGGDERLIAPAGHRPRVSPDGRWIAYFIGGSLKTGKIYIVSATGGQPRELRTQLAWAELPIWSPDSKHLLFTGSIDPSLSGFSRRDWWVAPMEGGEAIPTGAVPTILRVGMSRSVVAPITPDAWTGNHVTFIGRLGESTNLWQVPIDQKTWKVEDPPERLTAGGEQEWGVSLATDGRMVFAALEQHVGLWTLALDANAGKARGKPQVLTQTSGDKQRPSMSSDGRKLVFQSYRSGNSDVGLRDMASGKETALTATPWDESHPYISPDGAKVVYGITGDKTPSISVLPLNRGVSEKLCEDCGMPMGWSPDGTKLLYFFGSPVRWGWLNPVTRQRADLIQHPKYNIHMARISPDGNWLSFHTPVIDQDGRSPVFIAPLRAGVAAGESEWIQVTDGSGVEANPWWSPDGSLLYFLSNRDGFQCIWAVRLDRTSRKPIGSAFDVAHFHSARSKVQEQGFGPGVTKDLLVFTLSSSAGNIWSAK